MARPVIIFICAAVLVIICIVLAKYHQEQHTVLKIECIIRSGISLESGGDTSTYERFVMDKEVVAPILRRTIDSDRQMRLKNKCLNWGTIFVYSPSGSKAFDLLQPPPMLCAKGLTGTRYFRLEPQECKVLLTEMRKHVNLASSLFGLPNDTQVP